MKKLISFVLLIVFLSSGLFTSCKKDKGDPPNLPPLESMKIDFTEFEPVSRSVDGIPVVKGTNNTAWAYSAVIAGFWKSVLSVTLALPVSSFVVALDQDPSYLSDKTWQWSYNVSSVGVTYKVRLTGQIGAGDVTWKMYVTKEGTGGFTDFLWVEGTSKTDGSSGQWILNESPVSQIPLLRIDWTKSSGVISEITYTYLKNDTYKDTYIKYGKLTSGSYDSYYKISFVNANGTQTADVEWSSSANIGRIKCSAFLGDSNWYCWNANKINITCP